MKFISLFILVLMLSGCYVYEPPVVYYPQPGVVVTEVVTVHGHYYYWDSYHRY